MSDDEHVHVLSARNRWVDGSTHLLLLAAGKPRRGCVCAVLGHVKLPYHAITCTYKLGVKKAYLVVACRGVFALDRRCGGRQKANSGELSGRKGRPGVDAEDSRTLVGDHSRSGRHSIF